MSSGLGFLRSGYRQSKASSATGPVFAVLQGNGANVTRSEALRLFHEGLDRVIPRAEALGVQLLIEPEPDLLMERTSEIKPFVAEIQAASVGINFDIGHFYCAGEDPAAAFEELFP